MFAMEAIYANENGKGMVFHPEPEDEEEDLEAETLTTPASTTAKKTTTAPRKSHLSLVKDSEPPSRDE